MTRQSVWLKAPEQGDVTRDFPAAVLPSECVRAHSSDYGPGWFATVTSLSSPLGGRFDLVVADREGQIDDDQTETAEDDEEPGIGTLYCANDEEAALRERLGESFAGRRFIAASELHDTAMSIVYPGESGLGSCIADTVNATGFLTREIHTMADYEVTRAWATAFFDVEFDGLVYEPRSTPGEDRVAFAIFGPAGRNDELRWAPHPTWWQQMVDKGIIIASISGTRAKIID